MIIYFEHSNGQLEEIESFDDSNLSMEDKKRRIFCIIDSFLKSHKFKSYYTRMWNEEVNDNLITCFDVGSHTEFFYCFPAIQID